MRIASWNVNGLRAAWRKGMPKHLKKLGADAVMLQEIRCLPEQAPDEIHRQRTYKIAWNPAEKKGYAGTGTWTRGEAETLGTGMDDADAQGRILRSRFNGVHLINVYLPSGSRSDEAQANKEAFMNRLMPWAAALAALDEPVILGGDLNIAHTKLDIHNATGNKRNSGFLPHEREWFTKFLGRGWTDMVRHQLGEQQGPYSWWSNRGRARELNRGWRIDYLLGNTAATQRLVGAGIERQGGMEVSDHAPIWVDLAD